jgi:hypothetical protein
VTSRPPRCITRNPATTRQVHLDWVATLTADELEQGSDRWPPDPRPAGNEFRHTITERPDGLLEIIYDAENTTAPTVGNEPADPPPEDDPWEWIGMWGTP